MTTAKKFETLTCEEFFESYMDGREWYQLADEMFWEQAFSADLCLNVMRRLAEAEGVVLTDADTWSYESFFWNAYKNTEKGLS